MGARDILDCLAGSGLRLSLDPSGGLRVEPKAALTDDLRLLIRANRTDLLAALSAREATDDAALEYFEERAAVREFEGGQNRPAAEGAARAETEAYRRACWERFQAAADEILRIPSPGGRERALAHYRARAMRDRGEQRGEIAAVEMAAWVRHRATLH
ncbi:MAG: hypothetical protein K2X67_13045 [Burkholderiales bacterium]|nr:hypothetical protein [Burkholderiales bacterium]